MSDPVRTTVHPFLRLGPSTGWALPARGPGTGILVGTDGLSLGVPGRPPIPVAEPSGTFGGRTLPRGVAIATDGTILLADPDRREVLVSRPRPDGGGGLVWGSFTALWPARSLTPPASADPYTLARPTDLAFSPGGDLALADAGAGRVLVLAYPSARLRHVVEYRGGVPTAVAYDRAGRLYVADPDRDLLHRYDRRGMADRGFPHPTTSLQGPEHLAVAAGPWDDGPGCACGAALHPPVALAVLDRSGLVLLDADGRVVSRSTVPDLLPGTVGSGDDGTLHWTDRIHPEWTPLPLPGLTVTPDGRETGTGLPLLARPRRAELPLAGTYLTGAIDGQRPGFAWDRLVLRGQVPADTWLLVSTLASDGDVDEETLAATDAWSAPTRLGPDDLPELLVRSRPGRYLWIRTEFFGDGRRSPHVAGIDIHGPRHSSIHRLPAPYHEDPVSRDFLDRYLNYFDTVFAEVEAEHRDSSRLFDAQSAPDREALRWLADWFGLSFPPEWGTDTLRAAVAQAGGYTSTRGTVAGLQQLLQWHTGLPDPLPAVIEHFRVPAGSAHPVGRAPLDTAPASHACTIVLPAVAAADGAARDRIDALLRDHLPAHVRAHIRYVPSGIVVGHQSTLGIDTLVTGEPDAPLGAGQLGVDLATRDADPEPLRLPHRLPHSSLSSSPRSPTC
jgi:phage tail-like protein